MRARLPLWAASLWWGSLSCIGFLVVPLLFVHLPSPAMAGNMAARLFSAQTWVSTVCALLILLCARSNRPSGTESRADGALIFIVFGMLLALLSEFAIAPRIVARDQLLLWHSLGSLMYVLQWGCAGATFWRLSAPRQLPG